MTGGGARPRTDRPAGVADIPRPWRATAFVALVMGAVIGTGMTRLSTRMAALLLVPIGCSLAGTLALASRRPLVARSRTAELESIAPVPLTRVAVLIPARDEADTLPALIHDLGAQIDDVQTGSAPFTVVVIDDGSVDDTGRVAARAARDAGISDRFHIVSRPCAGRPWGKAAALAAVPDACLDGSVAVVLDADARVAPDFVARVAAWAAAGGIAGTVIRRPYEDGGRLTRAQGDEQILDQVVQTGRSVLGGCPELRGNGMIVRSDVLREVGGWAIGSLTEDLELSTALLRAGHKPDLLFDIAVAEASVGSLGGLVRQRLRWAEGSIRRFLAQLVPAIRTDRLDARSKIDLGVYAGQLLLGPVLVSASVAAAVRRRPGPVLVAIGVYGGVAAFLTWVGLGRRPADDERGPGEGPSRTLDRSLSAGAFATHWLVMITVALVRIAAHRSPAPFVHSRDRRLVPDRGPDRRPWPS